MKPFICLITGPAGVGKTTLANLLAKRFPKTARIQVDELRHSIVQGKVPPFPSTAESERQLALAIKNATSLAKNYHNAGFAVFIDDVVETAERLTTYIQQTEGIPLMVFMLYCNADDLQKRDQHRPIDCQMGERALILLNLFRERINEKRWLAIDSTQQTAQETAKIIEKAIKQNPLPA